MLIDKQLEFSDSQAVTASALSTNVVDLGATNTTKDIGGSNAVYVVLQVDTTVTAAGAATVTFSLETDSDSALSTSPTVHYSSAAIAKTALVAGTTIAAFPLPAAAQGQAGYERYLAVRYTVGTGPLTAGAFSAFVTRDVQAYRAYANGI